LRCSPPPSIASGACPNAVRHPSRARLPRPARSRARRATRATRRQFCDHRPPGAPAILSAALGLDLHWFLLASSAQHPLCAITRVTCTHKQSGTRSPTAFASASRAQLSPHPSSRSLPQTRPWPIWHGTSAKQEVDRSAPSAPWSFWRQECSDTRSDSEDGPTVIAAPSLALALPHGPLFTSTHSGPFLRPPAPSSPSTHRPTGLPQPGALSQQARC
jgi:hypothetical protein